MPCQAMYRSSSSIYLYPYLSTYLHTYVFINFVLVSRMAWVDATYTGPWNIVDLRYVIRALVSTFFEDIRMFDTSTSRLVYSE